MLTIGVKVWQKNCTVAIVEAGSDAYQILRKENNVPFNIEYLRYAAVIVAAKVQDMGSSEVCFSHQSRHVKTHQSDEQHDAPPCVAHNMAATKGQI